MKPINKLLAGMIVLIGCAGAACWEFSDLQPETTTTATVAQFALFPVPDIQKAIRVCNSNGTPAPNVVVVVLIKDPSGAEIPVDTQLTDAGGLAVVRIPQGSSGRVVFPEVPDTRVQFLGLLPVTELRACPITTRPEQ